MEPYGTREQAVKKCSDLQPDARSEGGLRNSGIELRLMVGVSAIPRTLRLKGGSAWCVYEWGITPFGEG